jgi:hypothetical protein
VRWAGYVILDEEIRIVYKILVERPEEERPLGRPIREDDIKTIIG